ncbi:alpha-(1,3)-fucosyltransferase C-like [Daphnia carinata]|uniref:alpha-(1,3)-fucosyltransferase C-like n=1 Tax=Daphnia carinata TaxID=120202 RepID=UPI00257E9E64|nr:alpha-(1,3)-fucosyltransferase C-like [Daphnia carinata]
MLRLAIVKKSPVNIAILLIVVGLLVKSNILFWSALPSDASRSTTVQLRRQQNQTKSSVLFWSTLSSNANQPTTLQLRLQQNQTKTTMSSDLLSTALSSNGNQSTTVQLRRKQNQTKTILVWNGSARAEVSVFGLGHKAFINEKCAYTQCDMTNNRTQHPIEYYDAVVVVFNDEFTSKDELKMPEFKNGRNPNQQVVFFTQESPLTLKAYYNMSDLSNLFNWTMTYRLNADVPFVYGRITPKAGALKPEEIARYRQNARRPGGPLRNKTVAWMVSHCHTHSQRETYAKELRKYIDVDIYGRCGNLSCAKHDLHTSSPQCYDMLESKYKFYLSFENSICTDYVTEKFFKIMDHHIVPVVYGGTDYTKHAPPHSFIDASKFSKTKDLAAYLKLLDANDALYNEYFWWKDHYRVEYSINDRSRHAFCDLCQKLHEPVNFKSYKELVSEWGDGNQCKPFDPSTISK